MASTAAAASANRGGPRRAGMSSGTLSDVDPSMLPLRFDVAQAGRDVADDPMLLELVASLHVIRTATAPSLVVASLGRVDAASSKDEGPRPLASPRHSCGPPLVDELPSGGLGDGTVSTVQSFIEAFKRLLQQPLIASPPRLRFTKDPKAVVDSDFLPSVALG